MPEILLSGYFREELKRRIWGRGLSQADPIGSYVVTMSLSLFLGSFFRLEAGQL